MVSGANVAVRAAGNLVVVAEHQPNLFVTKRWSLLVGVATGAHLGATGSLVAVSANGVHFAQALFMLRGGLRLMAVAAILLVMAIGTLEAKLLDVLLMMERNQLAARVGGLEDLNLWRLDIGMKNTHDVARCGDGHGR